MSCKGVNLIKMSRLQRLCIPWDSFPTLTTPDRLLVRSGVSCGAYGELYWAADAVDHRAQPSWIRCCVLPRTDVDDCSDPRRKGIQVELRSRHPPSDKTRARVGAALRMLR